MMFKTVLFGGFLFATLCAATEVPIMASLEVMPNLDQGLTYKDFRVHYSGAGGSFSGSSVTIKIYKKDGQSTSPLIEHEITSDKLQKPNAYYFGYQAATEGDYEVDVCNGDHCSGRSPALTRLEDKHQQALTCENGTVVAKKWQETGKFKLDVIKADKLYSTDEIKNIVEKNPSFDSDWKKFDIEKNPSYKKLANKEEYVFYAAVPYDIAYYRPLFLNYAAVKDVQADSYAHEFCERKYLLSAHVHLLKEGTYEVLHRFKKTLYLSPDGIQKYIIDNTRSASTRPKVPVELAFPGVTITTGKYTLWISFCATEKDENDSTVCSDPLISDVQL